MSRVVIWFSCGAASACAAWLGLKKYTDAVVVYCDTLKSEHPDNARFKADVERWIGREIEVTRSKEYASVDEVFEKTLYMAGIEGARCTVEMKKVPRFEFQLPDDINLFGLTYDEPKRIADFEANNPELNLEWILRDEQYTKRRCYRTLELARIPLPEMYLLGFEHNNCIGCVKATSPAYWQRVKLHFPETFARRADQSRRLGVRLVRINGERRFLDEMTNEQDDWREEIECGPVCLGLPPKERL